MTTIKLLPPEEMKVIKQIKIIADRVKLGPITIGYICYERMINENYTLKNVKLEDEKSVISLGLQDPRIYPNDRADEVISQAILNTNPNSTIVNHVILFNDDLEKIDKLKHRESVVSSITFSPNLPDINVYEYTTLRFDVLEKGVTIYNDFVIEQIAGLTFTGYYNPNDAEILDLLKAIVFY
jgi:hypothetical protein